jgi:hypothetical protein
MLRRTVYGVAALLLCFVSHGFPQAEATKAVPLSPTARLAAAKSAYLQNGGGNEVAFNVVSESVQGWGRYQIVGDPTKADLIIEVASPSGSNGISISSTSSNDSRTGMPSESTTRSRDLQVARITMIVYDARSKMALWSSSEQPKSALRQKNRQDRIVETAQRLVSQFRQRVEPEPAN